ncbi:tRNA synthetase class I (I [Striga asiatica]|uniref:tRNA synthetase class I (I) n=1 Tax=Striga asiatica TaxID=4170 RepID=A0A5A7PK48_STRAF|nr:tRNA synthetase class I (I [Striga asiatica]
MKPRAAMLIPRSAPSRREAVPRRDRPPLRAAAHATFAPREPSALEQQSPPPGARRSPVHGLTTARRSSYRCLSSPYCSLFSTHDGNTIHRYLESFSDEEPAATMSRSKSTIDTQFEISVKQLDIGHTGQ